ncbi:MAG: hypothetical protein ACI4IA_07850 [Acutalibacteraceae bacterium]
MKNTDTVGSCQTDLIIGCIWKKMNKSSGSSAANGTGNMQWWQRKQN